MERLKNKVAIITGGGTGIGEVTAGRFVEEGAQLIVTDVSKESGDKVAKKLGHGCLFIQHDVRNEADWEKVIAEAEKQFGKLFQARCSFSTIERLSKNANLDLVAKVETL